MDDHYRHYMKKPMKDAVGFSIQMAGCIRFAIKRSFVGAHYFRRDGWVFDTILS